MSPIIKKSQNKSSALAEKNSNNSKKHTIFNETKPEQGKLSPYQRVKKFVGNIKQNFGNGCGVYNRASLDEWSDVIRSRIKHLPYIDDVLKILPNLFDHPELLYSHFYSCKGKKYRLKRAEGRFMDILLLMFLVSRVELCSGRVGYSVTQSYINDFITCHYIARYFSVSLWRVCRSYVRLKKSSLLSVKPICKEVKPGIYEGRAALKKISPEFFVLLSSRKKYAKACLFAKRLNKKTEADLEIAMLQVYLKTIEPAKPKEKQEKVFGDNLPIEIIFHPEDNDKLVARMIGKHKGNSKPTNSDPPQT